MSVSRILERITTKEQANETPKGPRRSKAFVPFKPEWKTHAYYHIEEGAVRATEFPTGVTLRVNRSNHFPPRFDVTLGFAGPSGFAPSLRPMTKYHPLESKIEVDVARLQDASALLLFVKDVIPVEMEAFAQSERKRLAARARFAKDQEAAEPAPKPQDGPKLGKTAKKRLKEELRRKSA